MKKCIPHDFIYILTFFKNFVTLFFDWSILERLQIETQSFSDEISVFRLTLIPNEDYFCEVSF